MALILSDACLLKCTWSVIMFYVCLSTEVEFTITGYWNISNNSAFTKNDRHVLTFPGCWIKKRIDLLLFAVSLSTKAPVSTPSFNSGQQVRNRPPSWLDSADCELPEASPAPTFAVFSSGWQPHRELFIYTSIYMPLAAHTCAPCKNKIL